MIDSLLEASNVSKRFGRVQALSDASFFVPANAVTAILGENGAGKTTAIKLILGFLRPDSGILKSRGLRIGYVPERPAFFPWLCGRDIIAVTARTFGIGPSDLAERLEVLSGRIGFDTGLLERRVPGYSLGNQKKLSYLQSLLLSPDLLIVDEPFSSLDPLAIRSVRDLFVDLRREGKTLLLSSHLISEMERICDEFIIIKGGRVIIQAGLRRLRQDFLFARLPAGCPWKKITDRDDLAALPFWERESSDGITLLAEKSLASSLAKSAAGGALELERPTLESLYFFFIS